MKVLAFPRSPTAPYQDLLQDYLVAEGVTVAYLPMVTGSQTLNLLLLPALLAGYRFSGYRILHIHWVYSFAPPWVRVVPMGRRLLQAWFHGFLLAARLLGMRIVWTAHNLLPHRPVFHDDLAARRLLVRSASAVVSLSPAALPALAALGATRVEVIPPGPIGVRYPKDVLPGEARRRLGIAPEARVAAFVGVVERYKGVDLLLAAAARLEPGVALTIVVAGRCDDPAEAGEIRALADRLGDAIVLHLGHVPDEELQVYFACADVVALPFRAITNSGSLDLALEFGRPVVIPALPELSAVPDRAAIRFAPDDPDALAKALTEVATAPPEALSAMGEAARAYAGGLSWEACARATAALYRELA